MSGILAIWKDCASGREAAYVECQGEHLFERVSISGFLVGYRYQAVAAKRRFLTTYEVDRPEVLLSAKYRERLAHPTERTTAIIRERISKYGPQRCEWRAIRGAFRAGVALTVAVIDNCKCV